MLDATLRAAAVIPLVAAAGCTWEWIGTQSRSRSECDVNPRSAWPWNEEVTPPGCDIDGLDGGIQKAGGARKTRRKAEPGSAVALHL
ncbi:hypothetical protein CGRA01v4_07478 [Colletotrichum graminicola]|nr:hypothetical protein CGRA01v4_07478 [Colletotrichum graminicola]